MKFEIINIEEFSGNMAQIYSIMYEGDDLTLFHIELKSPGNEKNCLMYKQGNKRKRS